MQKSRQTSFWKKDDSLYGGDYLKTVAGRSRPRPLSTAETMHLVLRSTKAKGEWSFRRHQGLINKLVLKFAAKNAVKILSFANVGNHLHFQIKLGKRQLYKPFIRGLTAAIAMAVTGTSRWKKLKKSAKDRFWDRRPFTRIVKGWRGVLNLRKYIEINELEGLGVRREYARMLIKNGFLILPAKGPP